MIDAQKSLFNPIELVLSTLSLAADTAEPDMVTALFGPDNEPAELGDEEDNTTWVLVSEILIGFGIVAQLAGWCTQSFMAWPTFTGIGLTLLALGIYAWGFVYWYKSIDVPSAKSMFRSWRINFIDFWVAAGVTLINIVFAWLFRSTSAVVIVSYGLIIATFIAAASIATGIFMGWRMKNLWWTYDPEGELANQPFDYFGCDETETIEDDSEDEVIDEAETYDPSDFDSEEMELLVVF